MADPAMHFGTFCHESLYGKRNPTEVMCEMLHFLYRLIFPEAQELLLAQVGVISVPVASGCGLVDAVKKRTICLHW